jgi:hypothetical protein
MCVRYGIMLFLSSFFCGQAIANGKEKTVYVFGNSLFHHLSDTDETAVPHWLHQLSVSAGHKFALNGQWGFLRDFANNPPPEPNWSFKKVRSVWKSETYSFATLGFDTVIINPANFIQYQAPTALYEGDNPTKDSPASAAKKLFNWVDKTRKGITFFVYEGWAELAPFSSHFPPNKASFVKFQKYNQDAYHDWYMSFVKGLTTNSRKVRLIPVASVIGRLITDTELRDLKAADLYSDADPHGTPTTYLLAGMITYAALYNEAPPASFKPPNSIHPLVSQHYATIVRTICNDPLISCGKP